MNGSRFAAVLILALAVGGCDLMQARTATRSTCRVTKCDVAVTIANGVPVFAPDELEIAGAHNVHIFWTLPPGYEFDRSKGDGVYLKGANDGEFSEMFPTDDENENPAQANGPARRYHWRDANSRPNPIPYKYKIQFRKNGTSARFCD